MNTFTKGAIGGLLDFTLYLIFAHALGLTGLSVIAFAIAIALLDATALYVVLRTTAWGGHPAATQKRVRIVATWPRYSRLTVFGATVVAVFLGAVL